MARFNVKPLHIKQTKAKELNASGLEAFQNGQLDLAKHLFQQALDLDPHCRNIQYNLALTQQSMGYYREAVAIWLKLEGAFVQEPDYWNARGLCHLHLSQTAQAIFCFSRAVSISRSSEYLVNLATALFKDGRFCEAVFLYEELVKGDPANWVAINNLAACLEDIGRMVTALFCYDRALQIWPDAKEVLFNKASCLYKMNRLDQALAEIDKLLAITADWSLAWQIKSSILQKMGRTAEAVESFNRSIGLSDSVGRCLGYRIGIGGGQ